MSIQNDEKWVLTISDYIRDQHIFLLDSSRSSRQILANILTDYGVKDNYIHSFDSIESALNEYNKWKPCLVFSDYRLKNKTAFDFFRECRKINEGKKDSLFVMVTSIIMQSVISKAAEEDIDAYIIRPFSKNMFDKVLRDAIYHKVNPSDYMKLIEAGLGAVKGEDYDTAILKFEEAMKLDQKPALAYAYYSTVKKITNHDEVAIDGYLTGLEYNSIHYKCLRGLFELLMSHHRYTESYEIAKQLTKYFPTSENILSSVIRLAIITKNLKDMDSFYLAFQSIDFEDEILQKHVCAGMFVTGKYFLKHGDYEKGIDLFEKISNIYGGNTQFLKAIIETLLENDYYFLAYKYFGLFNIKEKFSKDYLVSSVLINFHNQTSKDEVLPKALDLINQKVDSRLLFRQTLSVLSRKGDEQTFNQVMGKAIEVWPSFRF